MIYNYFLKTLYLNSSRNVGAVYNNASFYKKKNQSTHRLELIQQSEYQNWKFPAFIRNFPKNRRKEEFSLVWWKEQRSCRDTFLWSIKTDSFIKRWTLRCLLWFTEISCNIYFRDLTIIENYWFLECLHWVAVSKYWNFYAWPFFVNKKLRKETFLLTLAL